jgi:hypothetical protein
VLRRKNSVMDKLPAATGLRKSESQTFRLALEGSATTATNDLGAVGRQVELKPGRLDGLQNGPRGSPRPRVKIRMAMGDVGGGDQQGIGFVRRRHILVEPNEPIEPRWQRKVFDRPILGDGDILPGKVSCFQSMPATPRRYWLGNGPRVVSTD